jgi:hypothetical protein
VQALITSAHKHRLETAATIGQIDLFERWV